MLRVVYGALSFEGCLGDAAKDAAKLWSELAIDAKHSLIVSRWAVI
jgi:hypothetical protein